MDVFLTGGSGYVGGYVIAALRRRGHRVFALARGPQAARRIEALGCDALLGEATNGGTWEQTARRVDAIVHLASPRAPTGRGPLAGRALSSAWVRRVAAFESAALPRLVAVARANTNCRALVTTTGPAASGDHGERWVGEDELGPTSAFGSVQRMIERITLDAARAGVAATVLRPGAVYGHDGGFAARILEGAAAGRSVFAGPGDNYVSWVHIDDYAEAYVRAVETGGVGQVIAVVDDAPITSRSAMEQIAGAFGRRAKSIPRWLVRLSQGPVVYGWATMSARVRNARAHERLGWRPRFSNFDQGLADVLARFRGARS